ncbi:AraC family transcriptional regulator [Bacteroides sp. 51]|uniref:helix-turn-helix domain-containing protein n=1 Tax=Bacteroides sp. 51 TaxID=2302938 RepID=UPI0013D46C77|nr:helix-turn-helix domain-containing protein [Bacteroides sp. 51]
MILMALMAVSTYVWAVFYEGITDYNHYYKLDIIDTTFTLFLFPLIYFYFKSLVRKKWFGWREVLWLLPGFLIGSASAILYLAMGDANAASYIKEVIDHRLNLQVHTGPVYYLQVLVNIWGFYITLFIQALATIVITVIEFVKPDGYLRTLFRSPANDEIAQPRAIFIGVWALLLIFMTAFLGECFTPVKFPDLTSLLMAITGFIFFFLGYTVCKQSGLNHPSEPAKSEPESPGIVGSRNATGNYSSILSRFNQLMDEKIYLRKNLRAEDVAVLIHTNRTYISKLLREEFACNFTDFINQKRIEYAKTLMQSTPSLNQEEVAEKSGFTHPSSFSRIFKQYTGTTFRQAQKYYLSQFRPR